MPQTLELLTMIVIANILILCFCSTNIKASVCCILCSVFHFPSPAMIIGFTSRSQTVSESDAPPGTDFNVLTIIIIIIIIGLYNTEDGNYTEKKLEDSVLMVWKL